MQIVDLDPDDRAELEAKVERFADKLEQLDMDIHLDSWPSQAWVTSGPHFVLVKTAPDSPYRDGIARYWEGLDNELLAPGGWLGSISPAEFRKLVSDEEERREIIRDFVKTHLEPGVDYGTVGYSGKGKPCLFKPGAEKVCSMLRLNAPFQADHDTVQMAGGIMGLYAYVCYLENEDGLPVGEGRGAAELSERGGWTPNNAIKMAQKRALVDAVLRTAALSEMFTQDLEDQSQRRAAEAETNLG